uniref:Uncharacterized protein n=1 Tax=Timema monikensis TaxID=170555 RepID=A0A7R9EAZ0_9NEOP|nr:unnamed protein product [Timema monikensis]
MYPHLREGRMENYFGENLQYSRPRFDPRYLHNRDYSERSALDHAATKAVCDWSRTASRDYRGAFTDTDRETETHAWTVLVILRELAGWSYSRLVGAESWLARVTKIILPRALSGSVVVRCPLRNCGINQSTNIRPLQALSGSVVVRCPLRNCGISQSTNIRPLQALSGSVVVRCPLRNCGISHSTNIILLQALSGSVVVRCPLRNCGIIHSINIRPLQALSGSVVVRCPLRIFGEPFLTQKDDLIAELKMSKDISGIKKLKVERAKVEERQEKEMFTEITKQLNANTFVEKVR